jgi:Tol biopolymer transport system component
MTLKAGARLGPYEVIALLGAGGMGEVYKARDTRLDRTVAIKVLPAAWSQDLERRARLDREARAIATLSHPNICALHDVGHQDGVDYLVLEYLDGETLAARLDRSKRLSLDETMRIAAQIADALTAAHRAGVIHRDLKPGNVMLTKTAVKVLDFGLAKRSITGDDPSQGQTAIETAAPLTGIDNIVGTVPYMSPEQIEGRAVDARSDLFALGSIIYEMATGTRAFQGTSQASLMAAILERTPPPIADSQPQTPPSLERLVQKCLAKDPDARWQSAADVADELRWLSSGSGTPAAAGRPASRRSGSHVTWAVLAAGLAATAVWLWISTRHQSESGAAPQAAHEQVTFAGTVIVARLSPDGRSITYATEASDDARVVVRDLDTRQDLVIWRGRSVGDVEWFPDGTRIAVSGEDDSSRGIWLVSRLGGSTRRIEGGCCEFAVSPEGDRIAWAPQGATTITVTAVAGGTSTSIPLPTVFHSSLVWTRSNKLLARTLRSGSSVVSGPPDGPFQPMFNSDDDIQALCPSPSGDALYVFAATSLRRISLEGTGHASEQLFSGLTPTASAASTCSVSADGERLLHVRRLAYANLWRLDLERRGQSPLALTTGTGTFHSPQLSPDGQWLVASDSVSGDLLKMPAQGGAPVAITKGSSPAWSRDGQRLAFVSSATDQRAIWIGDANGNRGVEVRGAQTTNGLLAWLPDGRFAWQTADATNYQIRDLHTGRDEFLVKDPSAGFVFRPRFNPSADRVAVYWNKQTQRGLWELSWPAREPRFLAADIVPAGWSRDGAWIYGHSRGTRSIVRVAAATGTVEPVGQFPVGALPLDACDLTPDARQIICSLGESTADAWVIHHFDRTPRMR